MKTLFTKFEFDSVKSTEKLPLECYNCGNTHYSQKKEIQRVLSGNKPNSCKYCSLTCTREHTKKISTKIECKCVNCNKSFFRKPSKIKKSTNHFCSRSCSSTFNIKNKTTGNRRSKLEVHIEEQLTILYPDLPINFNKKDTIGSELDIFIPSLNVAFELNGIFHYEPIYGVDKLNQIQNNDISKSKLCHHHKIDLCIIDTTDQKYFKPTTSQRYLNIIINIINDRLTS